MAVRVRYFADDVNEAIEFYVTNLGFELQRQFGKAIAILTYGDLELLISGPMTSAARPMPDGTQPGPGGWNRFVHMTEDLESLVSDLNDRGVPFRNEIIEGPGGKQVLCSDPSGNVIELFQPAAETP